MCCMAVFQFKEDRQGFEVRQPTSLIELIQRNALGLVNHATQYHVLGNDFY